jgi:hypothetical protein
MQAANTNQRMKVSPRQHRSATRPTRLSTPPQKCIGSPEQKYINGADKKAPKLGALCLEIRLGADYAAAFPRRCGVSGACSD